ncbi:hypothetical protein Bccel_5597 [Pseudobacteroides cellulosolvens ATCC 35603 = DSM 2933]|uniref:Lipoprotein n=1 Tax=Pseudobacteroides cellulosolvens ATCC 35603 = DSM 2933 TaxID=398512 RepID=A0A0L6JXY9_9FIRM|nr:hypothetical protein Bccel_5597 [Pseudobacteroides cellulosolvens ATCC 35603 = DSM 2933]
MRKKLKLLLVFTLCITSLFCAGKNVYAGTMGSIPLCCYDYWCF